MPLAKNFGQSEVSSVQKNCEVLAGGVNTRFPRLLPLRLWDPRRNDAAGPWRNETLSTRRASSLMGSGHRQLLTVSLDPEPFKAKRKNGCRLEKETLYSSVASADFELKILLSYSWSKIDANILSNKSAK